MFTFIILYSMRSEINKFLKSFRVVEGGTTLSALPALEPDSHTLHD